jgi:methylenetetrahydrofolate dehydrogenase (NADP+) / methenyltetrahydrofolate cyclohydrolase
MMDMVIYGKKIADDILGQLTQRAKPEKFMAAVLVGDDKSSASFLAQKEKIAKRLGVDFRLYTFPAEIKNDELRDEVGKIAAHKTCGGVIVQLPLPEHLNRHYILNAIPPEKDVDVLGERATGAFYAGRSKVLPPAVGAVEAVLAELNQGKEMNSQFLPLNECAIAVVGLGILVGRPIANWAMRRAKETFLLRSTSDLAILKNADLVIAGVGKAGLIAPDMLKPGAGVIDFGYDGGKGDFDPDAGEASVAFYTPTPGGTGPVLVAKLFENFYTLQQGDS